MESDVEEYNLEGVREAIHNIHESYPPQARTPEIKELLTELYKIESELNSKKTPDTV